MTEKAIQLRRAVAQADAGPVLVVGAHNAMAGLLAARSGFPACWISSFEVSATLGLPDRNLVGCTEMAAVARSVSMASDLPVIVDADNGYGSGAAMVRAARELAAGGAAAMCVEDSVFPKRNSFDPARDDTLEDVAEFAGRLRATRAALGDSPFSVIARTEALIAGRGIDEAIARAGAYADAGADMVVAHSKDPSGEQAVQIAKRWGRATPLVTIPTAFPHLSAAELGALGYRVVVYANHLLRAAYSGMEIALNRLSDGQVTELDNDIAEMQEVFDLTETLILSDR